MNPAEISKAAAEAGLTPGVQMLIFIVGVLLIIAGPASTFMVEWLRRRRSDEQDGKNGDIQTGLYSQLNEQLVTLTKRLDRVQEEYVKLVAENARLRERIQTLESNETLVPRLRKKLEEKDAALADREEKMYKLFDELNERNKTISELQERVNKLESRLSADEKSFCSNCQYNPQVSLKLPD